MSAEPPEEPFGILRRSAGPDRLPVSPLQNSNRDETFGRSGGHNGWRMSYSDAGYPRQRTRPSTEEQTLARYWLVLRERIWVVVACAALVFAAAVAYVELAPRTYQSQAELLVQAAGTGDAALSALPILHQTGDPAQDVLTAASLVTTEPVAAGVVHSLNLKMSPGAALADIQATPIGQAGLIAVQATASSPQLAQRLANGFVDQTIALSTERMHTAIQRVLPTLQAQLAQIPKGQRYGPGTLGGQFDELQQLASQNDPTMIAAAPASLPTGPSSPKTKLSLVAGLLAGLLVGIGAAFLFHTLDPRVRREEQLRERFGLQVLARIPHQRHRRPRPLLPSELTASAQEGYRTLRTILRARARSGAPRAVLVTGSAPAEGKSTTAMSLAVALAHGGARVVLIEADLRKPTFAASFGLNRFAGIEAVASGKTALAKAAVTVKLDDTSFRVLAAHPPHGKGPDLPYAVVEEIIAEAKELADFVVIDSAPLTAVIDALPFAQLADEVVIVTRLGHTRLNKLQQLDDLLSDHGVSRMGIVLIGEHPTGGVEYYYGETANGNAEAELPTRASLASERPAKAARRA
jgi:capsular exopolysaccharide synthesis family protein